MVGWLWFIWTGKEGANDDTWPWLASRDSKPSGRRPIVDGSPVRVCSWIWFVVWWMARYIWWQWLWSYCWCNKMLMHLMAVVLWVGGDSCELMRRWHDTHDYMAPQNLPIYIWWFIGAILPLQLVSLNDRWLDVTTRALGREGVWAGLQCCVVVMVICDCHFEFCYHGGIVFILFGIFFS